VLSRFRAEALPPCMPRRATSAVFPVASSFPRPMACSRTVDVGGRPSQLRTKVAQPVSSVRETD
jgi:hypothetical protein